MEYIVAFIPAIIFLLILVYIDSFKLVKNETISYSVLWGVASAALSLFIENILPSLLEIREQVFPIVISPVIEETLKSLILIFFIIKSKIVFRIDGAIYGFAIGVGFALGENIYLMAEINDGNILDWIIEGFGMAIVHGGATSIMAVILMQAKEKHLNLFIYYVIGWVLAVLINSMYDNFIFSPVVSIFLIPLVVIVIEILIIHFNDRMLRDWLELEFESEVMILGMIRKGEFLKTKSGEYLMTIRDNFSKFVVVDMLSYISLYLELSIKAKCNLMLNEVGMPELMDKNIQYKLKELKTLEKNIGKTGLMAITPILRVKEKDLVKWSLL